MARKVVYLNLLEDTTEQAVTKLGTGLGTRYKRNKVRAFFGNSYNVVRYDVFKMLQLSKLGMLTWANAAVSRAEINAVREDCRTAWKIWVSAHGFMDCTDYCYGGLFGEAMQPICKWDQMVEFLEYMLPARGDRYKVELMICYAARTSAYRDPQQDAVPREQLKTSLAYKIFEGLGQGKTFTVTARTGATGFDETQGVITVEQDEHAELEYLRRHVLETPEYKAGDLWFKAQDLPTRTTLATKYNKRTIREVDAVPANTDAERRAKAYFRCQSEYREIRGRANDIRDLNRYGTIRYSTERQGIKIKNVFTGATLYEGPWL